MDQFKCLLVSIQQQFGSLPVDDVPEALRLTREALGSIQKCAKQKMAYEAMRTVTTLAQDLIQVGRDYIGMI